MSLFAAKARAARSDGAAGAVLPILQRLLVVVDAENRQLSERRRVDYQAHSQKKNQGLWELMRVRAALENARANAEVSAALSDLCEKLEINRRLLKAQLRAAQTVAGIVARAIREGQSDGTYSAYPWRDEAI